MRFVAISAKGAAKSLKWGLPGIAQRITGRAHLSQRISNVHATGRAQRIADFTTHSLPERIRLDGITDTCIVQAHECLQCASGLAMSLESVDEICFTRVRFVIAMARGRL